MKNHAPPAIVYALLKQLERNLDRHSYGRRLALWIRGWRKFPRENRVKSSRIQAESRSAAYKYAVRDSVSPDCN
jgi:hypothetical protein